MTRSTLNRSAGIAAVACLVATQGLRADDLVYAYEARVPPDDASEGWEIWNPCEPPCVEVTVDGTFVLSWSSAGELVFYTKRMPATNPVAGESLWVEWRFRSNQPLGKLFFTCDASFRIDYVRVIEEVFIYGDAVFSFSGDDSARFALDAYHTFRFETLDGVSYRLAVDGRTFATGQGVTPPDKTPLVQIGAHGGGCETSPLPILNTWDFVRYGTISYGEQVVAADPPAPPSGSGAFAGFLDARRHADLDCFAVTFDSPNYVYIDEITVDSFDPQGSPVAAPVVTATRRGDESESAVVNGVVVNRNAPDTVEIVLDRPFPMPGTTRFTINDGVATNVIEYTFARGDTDGDGRVTLRDVSYFQSCLGESTLIGPCRALDLNGDFQVSGDDFSLMFPLLLGPGK